MSKGNSGKEEKHRVPWEFFVSKLGSGNPLEGRITSKPFWLFRGKYLRKTFNLLRKITAQCEYCDLPLLKRISVNDGLRRKRKNLCVDVWGIIKARKLLFKLNLQPQDNSQLAASSCWFGKYCFEIFITFCRRRLNPKASKTFSLLQSPSA